MNVGLLKRKSHSSTRSCLVPRNLTLRIPVVASENEKFWSSQTVTLVRCPSLL